MIETISKEPAEPTWMDRLAGGGGVARVLRYLGTISLVVAAGTFLFQRWNGMDHLERYYGFLGFTLLIASVGWIIGRVLRDAKGAGAIAGLVLALTPVHFCVLGGFIYSQFGLDSAPLYSEYVRWVAPSGGAAIASSILGTLVMGLLVFGAFRAFLPSKAGLLTVPYLLFHVLLLAPVREPNVIAFLAFGAFVVGTLIDRLVFAPDPDLNSTAGRSVRLLQVLPYATLIVRTLSVYHLTDVFVATLFEAVAVVLYVLGPVAARERRNAQLAQEMSGIPATIGWLLLQRSVVETFAVTNSWVIPVVLLPLAGLYFLMGRYAIEPADQRLFRRASLLVMGTSFILNVLLHASVTTAFACLLFGLATTTIGFHRKGRLASILGLLAFVSGMSVYFVKAIRLASQCPWLALAVVGIATVLLSSLVERNIPLLRKAIDTFRRDFRPWD